MCVKKQHAIKQRLKNTCASKINSYNAHILTQYRKINFALEQSWIFYCLDFITDEVVRSSLRIEEEQLVWIFTG